MRDQSPCRGWYAGGNQNHSKHLMLHIQLLTGVDGRSGSKERQNNDVLDKLALQAL